MPREDSTQKPRHVVLQLNWRHQFQFAGYYAAKEKGFYREAGLDVEIHSASPDESVSDELLRGHADFMVHGTYPLSLYLKGEPIVALAMFFQHSPSVILTRAEAHLQKLEDLSGKRLMISAHGIPEVQAMLEAEPSMLPPVFVRGKWDLKDLISGKVDAITAYSTNEPFILAQAGVK